jgi:hypothetical protein
MSVYGFPTDPIFLPPTLKGLIVSEPKNLYLKLHHPFESILDDPSKYWLLI